ATPVLYTLSLHDALPILIAEVLVDKGEVAVHLGAVAAQTGRGFVGLAGTGPIGIGGRVAARILVECVVPGLDRVGGFIRDVGARSEEHTSELQSPCNLVC